MFGAKVEVKDRTALVTGAARGMGRLWAEHLLADGAKVVLWDLDAEGLAATAEELRSQGGQVATGIVDVTDRARVYEAAEEAVDALGPVDVLVNNAGVVFAAPFVEAPDERLELTLRVNLEALLWTTKAVLPSMIERKRGHIVNIGSASGYIGVPLMPAYAASKWGVLGLTDSLRLEMEMLGHEGIGFTVFCPSYVDTGMFEGVKAPLLVPLLKPAEAVRKAYKGFRKGRYIIREPLMVKLTPGLRTLLPRGLFDLVSNTLGVTASMTHWTGRKDK